MAGGRGRGRGRGGAAVPAPADALPSGGQPSASASTPSTAAATGRRACEVCEAAPGIPFCKVEWSFLCSSCGPNLHRDSWIVAVPPFPTPPVPPNTAGTDASSQVSPYFFPPFMQMPPNPMQLPPMPMPMHPPNTNTNINAGASAAGVKRKRRRARFTSVASKEQTPSATDPNPNPNPDPDSLKRKTRQPPPAPTSADAGNAYTDLCPVVQGTTNANAPQQSAEDGGAQLDTMESIAAGMEPPPLPELDELEQGIEAQREQ